ncbi:MAG: hypothetical protein AAGE59_13025 [Cyanobacteria bacterium P01_F01_bin.86]
MHNPTMWSLPSGAIASTVRLLSIACVFLLASCTTQPSASNDSPPPTEPVASSQEETLSQGEAMFAQVTAVETTGNPSAYTFAVTLQSPDTGCDQYANWWEVVSAEGELLYRRILAHSHVDEQPFRRSGGPVAIAPDQTVIVRAHMDPQGYGTQAMQGTIATGFEEVTLQDGFATNLATAEPQPNGCAY